MKETEMRNEMMSVRGSKRDGKRVGLSENRVHVFYGIFELIREIQPLHIKSNRIFKA